MKHMDKWVNAATEPEMAATWHFTKQGYAPSLRKVVDAIVQSIETETSGTALVRP